MDEEQAGSNGSRSRASHSHSSPTHADHTPDAGTLLTCSVDTPDPVSHEHIFQSTLPSNDHNSLTGTQSHDTTPQINEHDVVTEDTLSKLYQDDSIGDTVFSKAWVLSILVEIINSVNVRGNLCSIGNEVVSDTDVMSCSEVGGCVDSRGVELEEEFEGRVCALWDSSMNSDVAEYIHEQGGIDLLLGAACRIDQPRLTEICLGIIGNIICSREICLNSFKTAEQMRLILEFLKDTDSGVLCQVTRLVQTCCSYEELQSTWLPQIMESKFVKDSLLFILQGSTNEDLLASTSVLLDHLLNASEQLLRGWVDRQLVEAICEAAQQIRDSNFEVSCSLVAAIHTLTSEQEGVACVLLCADKVCAVVNDFLTAVEQLDSQSTCITTLTAACSLYLTLSTEQRVLIYESNVKTTLRNIRKKMNQSPRTKQLVSLISRILT